MLLRWFRLKNRNRNWYILTRWEFDMFLIAGLGNPGKQYEKTKHNVGFDTIDELADAHRVPCGGTQCRAMYGKGMIGGQKVILAKPLTYMNLSGEALRGLTDYYKIDPETELIVVYDDISLAPGQIRVRKKGSAGGHNGIKNIISRLGTQNFIRVRVGIGEKPPKWDLADYVLAPFQKEERQAVDEGIRRAAEAVCVILEQGADAAMNLFNQKQTVKE